MRAEQVRWGTVTFGRRGGAGRGIFKTSRQQPMLPVESQTRNASVGRLFAVSIATDRWGWIGEVDQSPAHWHVGSANVYDTNSGTVKRTRAAAPLGAGWQPWQGLCRHKHHSPHPFRSGAHLSRQSCLASTWKLVSTIHRRPAAIGSGARS